MNPTEWARLAALVAYGPVMVSASEHDEKRMRLRISGTCRLCGARLEARTDAVYERASKTVRCLDHDESPSSIYTGTAGASARREFERRHQAREERVRAKHPRLAGLILALGDDPQSTKAWDAGAVGEERLGRALDEHDSGRLRVLHDRRIPGTRTNIDHLAITPTGVWVIDAKKYSGRPRLKVEGGLLRERQEKLVVGSRDCTRLVLGMHKQMLVVAEALSDERVPVHGVLCFVEADWPLLDRGFSISGVSVLRPKSSTPSSTLTDP